jgi:hypothetical protein
MGETSTPVAPSAPLSTTAIVAIATGIGISLICIIALIVLLVRAVRNHKQLLADLEERGVFVAQAQGEAQRSVARPRTVLRRNPVLPYHKNSGWGTLTSVETITSTEAPGVVAHYVPPKPTEAARKASRLSWPFHTRRVSGHNIHLKKVKGSRLSTVLEDPKPSALVPILDSSHLNASRPSLATSSYHEGRPSSSQSLLQYHPAFRSPPRVSEPTHQQCSDSGSSFFRAGANERLQRAKSFADVPSAGPARPQLRARSASVCSHVSGRAPDVLLPPLPLDIVRVKSEAKRRSQLRRIPSKQSESSFGSADTSILAGIPSPVVPQVAKRRPQKITKPRTRGSTPVGSRAFRDSLDLRAKVLSLLHTPSDKLDWTSAPSLELSNPYTMDNGTPTEASSSQIHANVHKPKSVAMYTPQTSPTKAAGPTTPKRKLRSQAYSEGSPERHKRSTATSRGISGVIRSPKRQHSQTSSRSSGGNPFQWDPAPLFSTGKPSALKGSPSARQGHRRKNSVRISLVPTFHGPPTRTSSPSFLVGNKEDTTEGAAARRPPVGLGLAVPRPRSLPTPPSSSTFAPELKLPATQLRASLTMISPTLPFEGYDQPYVVFPTDQVLSELAKLGEDQQNDDVVSSSSPIPDPSSIIEPDPISHSTEMSVPTSESHDLGRGFQVPETPYLPQSPFRPETPDYTLFQCYTSLIDFDGYDSERQSTACQTSANTSSRTWQSAFATIPEEASVSSQRTVDVDFPHYEMSRPISPSGVSSLKFNTYDRSAYNLPIHATTIPEETQDTIDPTILSKDTFALLNNSIKNVQGNIADLPSSRSSLALVIPDTPDLAELTFEPLLEAAFPFDTPPRAADSSPVLGHQESEASSVYSLPSPLPSLSPTTSLLELSSPIMPCSPRPAHTQLPTAAPSVSIDFSDMPKLAPSPSGPRRSPPRPLRTSIAVLRRMNSDAAKRKKDKAGRGERRYLRLGREDSVPLPGDESWLDEMDNTGSPEASDPEGTVSPGHASYEWNEGHTVLDLNEGSMMESMSTVTPDTELYVTSFETDQHEDVMAGAEEQVSSIWDDSEKFWTSPTSSRPVSPQRSKGHYRLSTPSPITSPLSNMGTDSVAKVSKKRDFEVAKDSSPTARPPTKGRAKERNKKKRRESLNDDDTTSGASNIKHEDRSVLGNDTTNVRIQVTSPDGQVVTGLPGSLYDSQGFLKY